VAGVDILALEPRSGGVEVNSSPGLEGIETVTGVDIASRIIELVEKNARPGNTRTKGSG